MSEDKGLRYNDNKPMMSLITPEFLEELAKVLTMGAVKYHKHNWLKGLSYEETYDSLLRHANAWLSGEMLDKESGLHHMAHVACNAMFLLTYDARNTYQKFDDRPDVKTTPREVERATQCFYCGNNFSDNDRTCLNEHSVEMHTNCFYKWNQEKGQEH
jgi:hypothetical protein